jgi:tetratricopeptide (TPR) repeat protein
MGYFVRVSGLVLLWLLSVGAVVGRSDEAVWDLVVPKETDDPQSRAAEQLIKQGNQEVRIRQYGAAKEFYKRADEIYRKMGNIDGQSRAATNSLTVDRLLMSYDRQIAYYQRSLGFSQRGQNRNAEDRSAEADALASLGTIYGELSQYDKAITYHGQSLPIFQQLENPNSEAWALNGLGKAYWGLSQHDKAIAFYKQSINVSESIRYRIRRRSKDSQRSYVKSIAVSYDSLAELLTQQGRSTEAQAVLALLDRMPPNNADGIPLTPAEQKILAEFAK